MWDDAKQLNAFAAFVTLAAFAALCWSALSWLVRQPAFAFHEVHIQGPLVRASPAHVEAVIRDPDYADVLLTFYTNATLLDRWIEPLTAMRRVGMTRCR